MRLIGVIFGKELRDHLRDRRSLMSALMFPLLGPATVVLTLGMLASWQSHDRPLEIAVVGRANAPSLVAFLERAGAQLTDAPADYEAQVRADTLEVVLVIPPDYPRDFRSGRPASVQLVEDGSNNRAQSSVARARRLLQGYARQIGALRLVARGVSPELASAVQVDDVDLATKQQQAAALLNMIPVFLLMAAFLGGMHVAIDSMAGERERGSLEPLMVNPVPPLAVVLGKWLATVVAAAVAVVLMIFGMQLAVAHVPLEELGLRVSFGGHEIGLLLAALLPLALFTAALQLLVATFARSFKEAQTYVTLVMFVPVLPGIFLSLSPLDPRPWMNWVPTLGQQLLMTAAIRGDAASVLGYLAAAAGTLVATAICVAVTARLLVQEKIVFGR